MKKVFFKIIALLSVISVMFGSVFSGSLVSLAKDTKTKVWTFENSADLSDFNSYYWSRSGGYLKESSVTKSFKLSSGKLICDNSTRPYIFNGEGKPENISSLTLNDPTIRNFDATYKVKKTTDESYAKFLFIGIREKTPGQLVNGQEWNYGIQLDGTTITALNLETTEKTVNLYNKSAIKKTCQCNDFKASDFNTVRVRAVENRISLWINGTSVISDYTLEDGDNPSGYLSLYYSNSQGEIDEISVTRLDSKGNEIDFVPDIKFSVSPLVLKSGISKQDVKTMLPAQVNAVYGGYEVPVKVGAWESGDYNPSVSGSYTFSASVEQLATYFTNCKVNITVKVSDDIIDCSLKDYDDINSAFESLYSNNILQSKATKLPISEKWLVGASGIKRKPSENANNASDSANMAILTYKAKKMSNFVLTVNYKQGSDSTQKAPIVGFGSDKTDKFASDEGGGYAAYVTADGKLKLWSNSFNTSPDFRMSFDISGYDASKSHILKLIVGSTKANYYVDGTLIASIGLTDYKDGYVYLALNSNTGEFSDFSVSPLLGIQSVKNISDVKVKLGTTIEKAKSALPATVKAVVDDGTEKTYKIIEWTTSRYNPDYSGRYRFTGKLDADSALNPAGLEAYTFVEVCEDYDPDITDRFYFDNETDLKNFDSYFAKEANPNVKGYGFTKTDWRKNWNLTDGMLSAKYSAASSDTQNVSMLVLNKQKYKNFELSVDFKQGTETYRWAMLGFGAKNIGEFALSQNGGRVHYLQQEGIVTGWGSEYVTGWEYHESFGNLENYERNAIHRMKIIVLGDKVSIYVDDYAPVVTDAPDNYNGGYIYLAVNGNSALFDNLTVIDYDKKSKVITKVEPSDPIIYNHNDKFAEYELCETVEVLCNDNKHYPMSVEWNCKDFRSNIPGVYKFSGELNIPSNKFSNPKKLKGSLELTVIVDYDPKTSIKYYFDSDAELEDFACYYTATDGNDGLKKVKISEQWKINEEGRIARINHDFKQLEWSEAFASTKISTLVWDVMSLENFEIEVDYKQGSDTWLWAMVMFGIKDPTKWIMNYTGTDSGTLTGVGGYACYAQQEGSATVWGDFSDSYRKFAMLPGVVNYDRSAVNHMKIRVVNGIASLYINQATQPFAVETAKHDTKGKIALACGMNLAEYDNLKITALDSKGKPANVNMSNKVSHGSVHSSGNVTSPSTGDTLMIVLIAISAVFVFCGMLLFKLYCKGILNGKH